MEMLEERSAFVDRREETHDASGLAILACSDAKMCIATNGVCCVPCLAQQVTTAPIQVCDGDLVLESCQ